MIVEDILPQEKLEEGPNDPSIYKAVFLAGGPGSGKSFVVRIAGFDALGFKTVNSDNAFEKYLADAGLISNPENIYSPKGQELRSKAKSITNKQMQGYLRGTLGLIIDGTGKDYIKITSQAKKLRDLGYDTAMVFVNTDLETALDRNQRRKRQIPDDEVKRMWTEVQRNLGKFQQFFGGDMYIIDNSDDSDIKQQTTRLYTKIRSWAGQ
jgi:predicted kinase